MTRPSPRNRLLIGSLLVLSAGLLLLAHDAESKGGFKKAVGAAVGGAAVKMVVSNSRASAESPATGASAPAAAAVPTVSVPIQKPVSSARYTPAQQVQQFDFSNKKDPFKPYVVAKTELPAGTARRAEKPLLPIHSFTLEQFRLIGVVADPKGNKAMVVDPSGKGYVLKVGMTIGRDEARITKIDTSGVDAVRQYRDENGKTRKETARISLPRKP